MEKKQKAPSTWALYRSYNKEYKRHASQYRMAVMLLNFVLGAVLLGVCKWIAGQTMKHAGIPYIAHSTIYIMVRHPLAMLILLLDLGLFALVMYFQFLLTIAAVNRIKKETFSLGSAIADAADCIRRTGIQTIPFILIYVIIVMPFSAVVFTSQAFNKIVIPTFILDYIESKLYLAIPTLLVLLVILYFALRWIYALPLLVTRRNLSMHEAFQQSKQMTKGRKIRILWQLSWITVFTGIMIEIAGLCLYFVQKTIDTVATKWVQLIACSVIATIIDLTMIYFTIRLMVIMTLAITPEEICENTGVGNTRESTGHEETREGGAKEEPNASTSDKGMGTSALERHLGWITKIYPVVSKIAFLVYVIGLLAANSLFCYIYSVYSPLVISHRGVDGANGVQNTIAAMEATIASSHPDYVEMDIHETKDGEFIVYHDENLKALCGIDARPHDLTLAELTQITARENGFTATLDSFDDYLAAANAQDQKLLIEIKTTKYDSPDMVQRFVDQYGKDIIEHGHRIHSMDLSVVEELAGTDRLLEPVEPTTADGETLYVGCIVPYIMFYPETRAQAYTAETTTIDEKVIAQASEHQQEIYAWTVNDRDTADKMITLGVSGIITDYPSMVREETQLLGKSGFARLIYAKLIQYEETH